MKFEIEIKDEELQAAAQKAMAQYIDSFIYQQRKKILEDTASKVEEVLKKTTPDLNKVREALEQLMQKEANLRLGKLIKGI